MTEQNSGHINFNNEEFPIPIPPVDQAWESMQQQLDMELPVGRNLQPRSPMRHLWIKIIVIATTVAIVTTAVWLYNHQHNENLVSSVNTISDTGLIVASTDVQTDSLSNTMRRQLSSSTINSSSDDTDTADKSLSSVSSLSSRSLPPSPQSMASVSSPVPSQPSVTHKEYPAQKNARQFTTGQQTANKQTVRSTTSGKRYPAETTNAVATTDQPVIDLQSLQSPASDKQDTVENTGVAAQQTTDRQQLPVKVNAHTGDRSVVSPAARYPLQLSMIQAPFAKHNTTLQHKADLLVLRPVSTRDREKNWALYIQLNIPLPLYGDSTYFMGPNGKDQFHRNLIPALRVERKLWKGALSLDVQPTVSAALKSDVPKKDSGITWYPYDTVRTFLKQYGWGLTLQYRIHILNKWQLGAGIQTSFYRKAVIYQKVSDSVGYAVSGIYPASPADKQDLSKVRFSGMAELNYVAGKWQLGLRTIVPITRVSKTRDISTKPLNMEFVIRRRLWTK
jgi:hypothetical protein